MLLPIFVMLAGLQDTQATDPKPRNPASWFPYQDYPEQAKRANHEGKVRFHATVDAKGRVTDCRIAKSSGWSSLDTVTCKLVMEHGAFKPARNADGKAVPGSYETNVNWALKDRDQVKLGHGVLRNFTKTLEIIVDAKGKVVSCESSIPETQYSGNPETQPTCENFKRLGFWPAMKDGKPVRYRLTKTIRQTVEPVETKEDAAPRAATRN